MSAFEYVSVLASIVVGLALCDVLASLHKLIRAGRAVRWHWAPAAAALLTSLMLIMIWWSLYQPEVDAGSTIGEHLPSFGLLVILFLLAAHTLPDEVPAEGLDLRAYWDRSARMFWILFCLAVTWILGMETIGAAMEGASALELLNGYGLEIGVFFVAATGAVFPRRQWVQAVVFLLLSTGPFSWVHRTLS